MSARGASRRALPLGALSVGVLAAALVGALPACGDEPRLVPKATQRPDRATLQVAGRPVQVEVVYTPEKRNLGLMHRTGLEPDSGMLFLFPDVRPRTFWMRNTLIDLDIAFLDADGVVLNVERGRAGVERPGYHSRAPAQFVLEMEAGWCEQAGLAPGDRIEISETLRALVDETGGG